MQLLKKNYIVLFPLILIMISLILLPALPEVIPMQFDFNGEASWTMPKWGAIWILPALQCFLILYNWKERTSVRVLFTMILLCVVQLAVFFIMI